MRLQQKVEDLDNHLLEIYSTDISDMKNKLENVVKAHDEHLLKEMVHDTLLISTLLRGRGAKTVGDKIQELKNATSAISEAFGFDWNDALLLKKISNASFAETKQIFEENMVAVKAIFSKLPLEDELEKVLRGEKSDETDTNENSESEYENQTPTRTGPSNNDLPAVNDSYNEEAPEDSTSEEESGFSESDSEEDE